MKCTICETDVEITENINDVLIKEDMAFKIWHAKCPNCNQKYIIEEVWRKISYGMTLIEESEE